MAGDLLHAALQDLHQLGGINSYTNFMYKNKLNSEMVIYFKIQISNTTDINEGGFQPECFVLSCIS